MNTLEEKVPEVRMSREDLQHLEILDLRVRNYHLQLQLLERDRERIDRDYDSCRLLLERTKTELAMLADLLTKKYGRTVSRTTVKQDGSIAASTEE